ncbi:MAG: ATP-grasp domain-containing protein [Lamprobacter sp.]|uniref:ATP-grasp domain-containing protein n=1 Tax=Lamprobacter sp. TaxID=3100796 RepID=UPI002B259128|nr:ATP-grasp domain-containing protein [Lamprobacter sp.]MEA3640055.1 ATP-grasp domain-containing protein [Lamprobacter sp.]
MGPTINDSTRSPTAGAKLAGMIQPARTPRILNHDIMGCTAEGVLGNQLYSGRALGASDPDDLIQLHPDLRPQWTAICNHYARIGLSHSREVIWDVDTGRLAAHPEHEPSVFYFGDAEQRKRPDERWYRTVDYINSKNRFMALANDLGVPVPRTLCFDEVTQISADDMGAAPYPCYLKAAVSVSGVGIYRCDDPQALQAAIQTFEPNVPVQIQDEVRTDCFLNLQYEAIDGRAERLAATEQILDGCVHQGNRHPVPAPPWAVVEPMADWLVEQGMRGVFAFDVAVIDTDEGREHLAIECNPRWNGASYPTMIARKLGIEHWLARTFPTQHRMLADIDLSGIEYDPRTGEGVILVNWGPVLVGKLLVLLAGDPDRQQALALLLSQRL